MTIAETRQEKCPECESKHMFVTSTYYPETRAEYEDHYCPNCGYTWDEQKSDIHNAENADLNVIE